MARPAPVAPIRTVAPVAGRPGALVIGGDYRGLCVARSLGRRGIPVWVLREGEDSIAATSRHTRRSIPWPSGRESEQADYLLAVGARNRLDGWALFPTGDETAALVARHAGSLSERFRLTTPPWEVMRLAYDKRLTYELAARVGLDFPWTSYPATHERAAVLRSPFPAILKPAFKPRLNRFTHARAWRVEDREQLLARYDEARTLVPPELIMVQEVIPGGGEAQFAYAALCADGRPLASLVARRTRQYPADFGHSSSFVETVDRPEVEQCARRLLAAMDYSGLVEVEFKRDLRDGRLKLLDVNPRLWTWHTIGRRVGLDFPYLSWQWVQGERVQDVRVQSGVKWVRMGTDVPVAAREIACGRLSPRDYIGSLLPPLELALFAADDPLPALMAGPLLARRLWRRRQ
jgi:D-aspartate ligase